MEKNLRFTVHEGIITLTCTPVISNDLLENFGIKISFLGRVLVGFERVGHFYLAIATPSESSCRMVLQLPCTLEIGKMVNVAFGLINETASLRTDPQFVKPDISIGDFLIKGYDVPVDPPIGA